MTTQRKIESCRRNWEKAKEKLDKNLQCRHELYELHPNKCAECDIDLPYVNRNNKFCGNSCAASFNNKLRVRSNESKEKTRDALLVYRNTLPKRTKQCQLCKTVFEVTAYTVNNKYCSKKCLSEIKRINGRKNGRKNAAKNSKRSKNEILFANLCKDRFNLVLTNVPMFNGWDADVIIEDIKMAVLWNGKWHYEKITENHSVKQVQNRDKIKIKEIKKCGYIPYVIKDMGSHNPKFVKQQFEEFLGKVV